MTPPVSQRILAGCVHAYTAAGGLLAFAALVAVGRGQYERCLLLLAAAFAVDATDGTLARLVNVKRVLPLFDGEILDLVIDFLTFAFVPLALLWKTELLPRPMALWAAAILLAALFDFGKVHAHKHDGTYTGLIAVWNAYAFYVYALRPSQTAQAVTITIMIVLTIWPLPFVHIMRNPFLRRTNILASAIWLAMMSAVMLGVPRPRLWTYLSLFFVVLYVGEAFWLRFRRAEAG